MQVELSGLAESDLLDIALYIAADNPERAFSFVDELQDACRGLADHPFRFPVLLGFEVQEFRRRIYGRYAIVYTVDDRLIRVLRIVPSTMDIDAVLAGN